MTVRVDASNADQMRAWNGESGDVWVDQANRINDGLRGYHARFLAAADVAKTSRILDVGCGSGWTTLQLARQAPDGTALGVDLSAQMLALARRNAVAEGLANVTFEQADAQVHRFAPAGFDVAVSRHGSMFFGDPVAAFGNIRKALRPGGRLVLLTWSKYTDNEWLSTF